MCCHLWSGGGTVEAVHDERQPQQRASERFLCGYCLVSVVTRLTVGGESIGTLVAPHP